MAKKERLTEDLKYLTEVLRLTWLTLLALERVSLGYAPCSGGAAILAALLTMQARCLHHH